MVKQTIIIITSVLLFSCSPSYHSLIIETQKPSAISNISDSIKSLTLIDRATTADFSVYDEKKMQQHFFDKKFNTEAILLDSTATDTTLYVLGQLLYDSGAFDVVIPIDKHYPHQKEFYELPDEMKWSDIEQICKDYNTDAVLALERYYNKVISSYNIYKVAGFENYAIASIASEYNVVAKLYDPISKSVAKQFVISDTIVWQQDGNSTSQILNGIPSVKEALIQTGIQVALDIDASISPQWRKERRYFFILDENKANNTQKLAKDGEWDKLYDYWYGYINSNKKAIRCKAEYNLALASEMLDEINNAVDWATKSINTKYMQQTKNYLSRLIERQSISE